jgi:hypothetical protein
MHRKKHFDIGKQYVMYRTRHLDPDVHRRLCVYTAIRGWTVEQALNTVLALGLNYKAECEPSARH